MFTRTPGRFMGLVSKPLKSSSKLTMMHMASSSQFFDMGRYTVTELMKEIKFIDI